MSFSLTRNTLGNRRFRPKGITVFQPNNLIQSLPGLSFWLDAAEPSTLSIDGSNLVDNWVDRSPSGLDVSQSISGSKPLFVSSTSRLNNKPTVEFDDDYLFTNAGVLGGTQGEVFAVVSLSSLATANQNLLSQTEFSGSVGPITLIRPYQDVSSQQGMGLTQRTTDSAAVTTEIVGSSSIVIDTPYLMYWKSNDTATSFRLNSATESLDLTTNDSGNWFGDMGGTADQITIGKDGINNGYIQPFLGNLGELIIVTGTNLTTQQRDDVESFLTGKWGL